MSEIIFSSAIAGLCTIAVAIIGASSARDRKKAEEDRAEAKAERDKAAASGNEGAGKPPVYGDAERKLQARGSDRKSRLAPAYQRRCRGGYDGGADRRRRSTPNLSARYRRRKLQNKEMITELW